MFQGGHRNIGTAYNRLRPETACIVPEARQSTHLAAQCVPYDDSLNGWEVDFSIIDAVEGISEDP